MLHSDKPAYSAFASIENIAIVSRLTWIMSYPILRLSEFVSAQKLDELDKPDNLDKPDKLNKLDQPDRFGAQSGRARQALYPWKLSDTMTFVFWADTKCLGRNIEKFVMALIWQLIAMFWDIPNPMLQRS